MDNDKNIWDNCLYFRWIEGFLSKETAACKLKENSGNKSGVFLLRFSDWNIRQSQGKDAIYGCISPSVLFQSKWL